MKEDPPVVYIRGDVTLQQLASSRRQPIIKWEESDVIQIHAYLARYRLARYECDKTHLDELAERLGLLRDFHVNALGQDQTRAFDRLSKEKHVTGDDGEWGPHTQRWPEPGWAGDRNGRGRDDGRTEIGGEGVELAQTPPSELGPDDSASVRLGRGVDEDAPGRSSLLSLPPRAEGLGEHGESTLAACNRVLHRDVSSLGERTEHHFNALHVSGGRLDVWLYRLERAPANRSVSSIDLSRLVLSVVNNNDNETAQVNNNVGNRTGDHIPLIRGTLPLPPHESSFRNMRQSPPQPTLAGLTPGMPFQSSPLPPLLHTRRDRQPLGLPFRRPVLHRPAVPRQPRDPRRALVEQLLSRQKGLLTDMIALAAGIRFTKYQMATHERFRRFRSYKVDSLGKTLCVARHRLGSSLAKVMAIEDTLTRAEPALRAPAGMNGLLHVIFALSCDLAVGK
ncbi:hypothetical protein ColTof4_13551 [Colletotrichum tofieldiae]|nr:hypothetical protein ColTof3_14502 [Colletotrichum tofieldiae]GKT81128.1 hypothetical protein ColTof4_13551 [Colletotrichum tofieldiae]